MTYEELLDKLKEFGFVLITDDDDDEIVYRFVTCWDYEYLFDVTNRNTIDAIENEKKFYEGLSIKEAFEYAEDAYEKDKKEREERKKEEEEEEHGPWCGNYMYIDGHGSDYIKNIEEAEKMLNGMVDVVANKVSYKIKLVKEEK